MNRVTLIGLVSLLGLLTLWLDSEGRRGTFDLVERKFVSWLAANGERGASLPPLSLVLYDEEASQLGGAERMNMMDVALFVRAASRLGAVAGGVEGVQGDPSRMVEAAAGMPVFGGYGWTDPPGMGWTALGGEPAAGWPEVPGLVGGDTNFSRGFLASPSGLGGVREILLIGRNGDRPVPSFLLLAWSMVEGQSWSSLSIGANGVEIAGRNLAVNRQGKAWFFPMPADTVLTMSELLVAAEKFEREGGDSPFFGHLLVLAQATSDIPRVAEGEMALITPLERWAAVWGAARTGSLFLLPNWWYPFLLFAAAVGLAFGPSRRSNAAAIFSGLLALLLFALVALAVFGSTRVLLPLSPALLTLGGGCLIGRVGEQAGWFRKKIL